MQAYEYINHLIPTLKNSDTVAVAMRWMEEVRVDLLPVSEGNNFLGFIEYQSDSTKYQFQDLIESSPLRFKNCWVYSEKPLYEIVRIASENAVSMVAVLNRDKTFLGIITLEDAISIYAESLSIKTQGSVLILSLQLKDYQLSEIARLIESENTQIINSFITQDPLDDSSIKLTLKLNKSDLRYVKANMERFGYKVIDHYQEETGIASEGDRIGNLLRFLDI